MDPKACVDSNRTGLGSLGQKGSTFTVGGQNTQGAQNTVNTFDYKPSGPADGMPAFFGANLQLDGEQRALKFSLGLRATDLKALAKDFVMHYYYTFHSNRAGLRVLYKDGSMLTFEGRNTQGAQNIINKLTLLTFSQHEISTILCQLSGPVGGMLVMVSGTIHHNEQRALKFSQTFHLMPTVGSSYGFYVLNDIFHWN